jgi:hypothetical protein
MRQKLKQFIAVGLVIIFPSVGFIAEYTHKHTGFAAIQSTIVNTSSGQMMPPQTSYGCWMCQAPTFVITSPLDLGLFHLNREPLLSNFESVHPLRLHIPLSFLRRAPPACLS